MACVFVGIALGMLFRSISRVRVVPSPFRVLFVKWRFEHGRYRDVGVGLNTIALPKSLNLLVHLQSSSSSYRSPIFLGLYAANHSNASVYSTCHHFVACV